MGKERTIRGGIRHRPTVSEVIQGMLQTLTAIPIRGVNRMNKLASMGKWTIAKKKARGVIKPALTASIVTP